MILSNIESPPKRKRRPAIFAGILLIAGGALFIQTTLAADISINAGTSVEFGQGMLQAVACSGDIPLSVTPRSTFVNASDTAGAFYFSSISVSNIPSTCFGKDFTIKALDGSGGSPLPLFNSTSTNAVVYNDAGTFRLGVGSRGLSLTRGSGTFTLTFNAPVALANTVFKVTIESGEHTDWMDVYNIGDTGPGGGIVFYYNAAGFNCGPSFTVNGSPNGGKCYHLEAAPQSWFAGTPNRSWASATYWLTRVPSPGATATAIGSGYRNTLAIIGQGNSNPATSAAALAQSYSGAGMTDWYLPSKDELHELYVKRDVVRQGLFSPHWSSSEVATTGDEHQAWFQSFSNGVPDIFGKISTNMHVFPIRAF